MGNAKWWVCDECKSLNDVPAKKCYKCYAKRPADPTLIDDQYGEVKDKARVSVTVDRSMVAALVAPDPKETADRSPFDDVMDDTGKNAPDEAKADAELLMREPPKRSIAALGGRAWLKEDQSPGVEGDESSGPTQAYRHGGALLPPGAQPPPPPPQRPGSPVAPMERKAPPPPPGSLPLPPPPPSLGPKGSVPLTPEAAIQADAPVLSSEGHQDQSHAEPDTDEPAQAGTEAEPAGGSADDDR